MVLRRGQEEHRRRMRAPYPSQWRVRRYTRSENFSIPGAGARSPVLGRLGGFTARGEVLGQRRGYSGPPAWWRISTETTRKRPPPEPRGRPGADHLLASGAARRGGGLCCRERPSGSLFGAIRGNCGITNCV